MVKSDCLSECGRVRFPLGSRNGLLVQRKYIRFASEKLGFESLVIHKEKASARAQGFDYPGTGLVLECDVKAWSLLAIQDSSTG